MRSLNKYVLSIFAIFFLFTNTLTQSALAAPDALTIISDTFHREVSGKFTDDSLGESILNGGDLYEKVANAPKKGSWLIDPQVIEEIVDMSDGYTVLPEQQGTYAEVAKSFIELLRARIGVNTVFALPYGSPDINSRKKISDMELSQIQSVSSLRLSRALDVPVSAGLPDRLPISEKAPSKRATTAFLVLHKTLNRIGNITSDPEVAEIALRSNALLNAQLSRKQVQYLSILLNGTVDRLEKKVKVLPGNYTLTSTNEKIPVTIVNEFAAPAEVVLILHAENARIVIDTAKKVRIDENSRKQVLITAKSVANGKVRVEARLETVKGARYGESNYLEFTISMFGSVISWVMAGAAILLFTASGVQIFRRARRKAVSQ
jgi:hypothetical protein